MRRIFCFRNTLLAAFLLSLALIGITQAARMDGTANLVWNASPEHDIESYQIFYGTDTGKPTESVTVSRISPLVRLSGLDPSLIYYCRVRAVSFSKLAGPLSAELAVTPETATLTTAIPDIAIAAGSRPNMVGNISAADLGSVSLGRSSPSQIFIVNNFGRADLTGISMSLVGLNTANFTLEAAASKLSPGGSSTFKITYTPLVLGPSTATLRISSNDPDERLVEIVLSGTATPRLLPILTLADSSGAIISPSSASIHYDTLPLGSSRPPTLFSITNNGAAPLTNLLFTLDGPGNASFILTPTAETSLDPGASSTFSVTFNPTEAGEKVATLHLAADLVPRIDLSLSGSSSSAPEIDITESDLSLTVGETSNFPETLADTTVSKTYTVWNRGTAELSGLTASVSGSPTLDYQVSPLPDTLAPGDYVTFQVIFTPSTQGFSTAKLTITSNDADESPFLIRLSGQGVIAPEIEILTSSYGNFIEFGSAKIKAPALTQIITIRNVGSARLNQISIAKSGPATRDFIFEKTRITSLDPGASLTLKINFRPTKSGIRNATLVITSNDADEKTTAIRLTGIAFYNSAPPKKAKRTEILAPRISLKPLKSSPSLTRHIGQSYRTLALRQDPSHRVTSDQIQVSSDLIHWSSGENFTTTLLDTPTILQVRDNTPLGPNTKRYIRLRP